MGTNQCVNLTGKGYKQEGQLLLSLEPEMKSFFEVVVSKVGGKSTSLISSTLRRRRFPPIHKPEKRRKKSRKKSRTMPENREKNDVKLEMKRKKESRRKTKQRAKNRKEMYSSFRRKIEYLQKSPQFS